ncbi:hypothetical protein ACOSP7_004274 [Xanthoceras sorbifolium]
MSAMIASPETVSDPMWYPDSVATYHYTLDGQNLMNKVDYQGKERMFMGNGTGLVISSIGSNAFNYDHHTLMLKNILHMPHIIKTVLSVSKFVRDNHVCVEFHPLFCLVNDQATKKTLIQGVLKNGLYVFDLPFKTLRLNSHSHIHSKFTLFSTSANDHAKHCCTSSSCINKTSSHVNACCKAYATLSLWHKRLEHPSLVIVKHVIHKCNVPFSNSSYTLCDACQLAKSHKLPLQPSKPVHTQSLALIVANVCNSLLSWTQMLCKIC